MTKNEALFRPNEFPLSAKMKIRDEECFDRSSECVTQGKGNRFQTRGLMWQMKYRCGMAHFITQRAPRSQSQATTALVTRPCDCRISTTRRAASCIGSTISARDRRMPELVDGFGLTCCPTTDVADSRGRRPFHTASSGEVLVNKEVLSARDACAGSPRRILARSSTA